MYLSVSNMYLSVLHNWNKLMFIIIKRCVQEIHTVYLKVKFGSEERGLQGPQISSVRRDEDDSGGDYGEGCFERIKCPTVW